MGAGAVFLRSATGLVRELSLFDVVNVGLTVSAPLVSVALNIAIVPTAFPGANIVWSMIIALPLMIVAGLFYVLYTLDMPRTGGDYVWVSRTTHPIFGLMANWGLNWTFINYGVLDVISVVTVGLAPVIYTLAEVFNQPGWVSTAEFFTTTNVVFVVSTVIVVMVALLFISSTRNALRFLLVTFALSIGATFVLLGLLFVTPNSAYVASFNQHFAGTASYQGIIDAAVKGGYQPGFTWSGTISFLPITFLIAFGWNYFGYFGGEIKRASRNVPLAAILIPTITVILVVAITQGMYNVIGSDFMNANNYLLFTSPKSLPYALGTQILGTVGTVPLLISYIATSPIILAIANLGLLLTFIWGVPGFFVPTIRSVFAYSFDRMLPTKLAEVNSRTHSPVWTIATIAGIYEILLVLNLYYGLGGLYVNLFGVYALALLIVAVSGLLYPFLKPRLWESGHRYKVAGIPAIALLAAASIAIWTWILYLVLTLPAVGGTLSYMSLAFAFGGMFATVPWYFVVRAYQKSKNIDFDMQFREIPPE